MITAPIDDKGTVLAYLDSGPVEGDTYTTLLCVHGHTYHGYTFSRLIRSAPKYNLRVVAINRRDYKGSTLYSQEELDELSQSDADGYKSFMRLRGLEIARFLVWFTKKEKIPPAKEDGTGGLALMGWSAGNMTTMAFMRHASSYPAEIVQALKPYFRTIFIYDASNSTLGYPTPPGCYNPFISADDVPERMRGLTTGIWVSSYFQHPSLSSRSLEGLQQRPPTNPDRSPTLDTLSPEDLIACIDTKAGSRSEPLFYRPSSISIMHDQTWSVLFPTEDQNAFAEVKVRMLVCTSSIWSVLYGSYNVENEIEWVKNQGGDSRPFELIRIEGANHFYHWADPEGMLKLISEKILN